MPLLTVKTRVILPPLRMTSPPPSIEVEVVISFGLVTAMVQLPVLKVTAPPPARAVSNAASLQLPTVPSAAAVEA